MSKQNYIKVWNFEDAPKKYKRLSPHGGDEDWLAFVPDSMKNLTIDWLEEGSSFGCCSVSEHNVNGGIIKIGTHA